MRDLFPCAVLLLALPLATSAQEPGALLPPGSNPGERLTVTTTSGERVTGRLLTDRDGAVVLVAHDEERTIGHLEIDRVTQRHNRFLFGPLIGLGVGLATGLPLKQRFDNEGRDGNVVLTWTVGVGVVLASVIDLVNGSERTIYARKPGMVSGLQLLPSRRGAEVRGVLAW
jgi:hypothetical protein